MSHFACLVETTFFSTWTVKIVSTVESRNIRYQFSLYERETDQLQYQSQQNYATKEEAYLEASFICLRNTLDREKSPAMIVDLWEYKILSINMAAFTLLGIDAVGFKTDEFTDQHQLHEQMYQELRKTGKSYQLMVLRDADGKSIEITIIAYRVTDCSRWGIVYFV